MTDKPVLGDTPSTPEETRIPRKNLDGYKTREKGIPQSLQAPNGSNPKEQEPQAIEIDQLKKYFDASSVQLKKLKFIKDNQSALDTADNSKKIADLLLIHYSKADLKTKTLTATPESVGATSAVFADYVKHVNAITSSKLDTDILLSNMQTMKKENVSVVQLDDWLTNYSSISQDIIFINLAAMYQDESSVDYQIRLNNVLSGLLQYQCETMIIRYPSQSPWGLASNIALASNTSFTSVKEIDTQDAKLLLLSHLPLV